MSMTKKNINKAIFEAKRFIEKAEAALNAEGWYGGKYNAAALRSSMDLTRALADLRRRPSYEKDVEQEMEE